MSVFNMIAAAAASGGLEYETGEIRPSSGAINMTITFENNHDSPPALTLAMTAGTTSTNYSTFAMAIVYGMLFGYPRGGGPSFYAQRISGRGYNTAMTINESYTSSNYTDVITNSYVTLSAYSSAYGFFGNTYYWIAIWI